ncbi:hypothetical protein NP233_g11777 [Leucocoprinus birnbaumii]|uniref:Uncharacterized protein n=1 Tax=Leucocoprinus birnbaumii TaxID=56174 RepID=A0AAD5VJG2_9AGAR|nr:hypothetical protein NP233_g11777 [Leucocoprinus birnbaumii]
MPPTKPASWRQIENSYARTYPWRTTYIFEHERLAEGVNEFKPPYREALKAIFSALDEQEEQLNTNPLFLALTVNGDHPDTLSKSTALRADALNALFNYRVVDLLAATLRTKRQRRRYTRVVYSPYMRFILEADLSLSWTYILGQKDIDWVAFLEQARKAQNTPIPDTLSLPTDTKSLFIQAAQYANLSSQSSIATHYATAACYLRYLTEYKTPYLSDSPSRLLRTFKIKAETLKLPPNFHILTPIVLMVCVSPLILLDARNLSAREVGATNHTKMWFRMYLNTPLHIQALEEHLMASVLSVGFGSRSPHHALGDFYQHVPSALDPALVRICK